MDNMNENLENITVTETAPEAPAEEITVEEIPMDEIPMDEIPEEPAAAKNKLAALLSRINITRKGLIIGGIVAAVLIIALVLVLTLGGGSGKVYQGTIENSEITVTVLEDGFKLDSLSMNSYLNNGWDYERCSIEKKSGNTYVIDGETMRLAHFGGDNYLVLDKDGKAVAGEIIEMDDEGNCYYYANGSDVTYSKNADGTYRLGDFDNVKLKSAGDGLYTVVSVNGEKTDDENSLIKLDAKLGVYRVCYRYSETYKVIDGEKKDILRVYSGVDTSAGTTELWFEGDFLTIFRVSKSYDYIQKQRGDDSIVYLLDQDGEVDEIVTITDGQLVLRGLTYKSLGNGQYYTIHDGEENRLHLYDNGTYKFYEGGSDDDLRGRAKLVWEPEEKLEVVVNGETIMSFVVDGKKLTASEENETFELTKVK